MIKKVIHLSKKIAIAFLLISSNANGQLVINELSQGGQNPSVEYVELVVTGTNTCTSSVADLRNYIIDDNNGTFASGAGTGIAAGCVRFKNIPFWQNIKIGTIIVIYDDGSTSINPLIPANDLSTSDGNCRLIIPYSNSTLLERHATQPGINQSTYPAVTSPFTSNNTWTAVIGMRNGGDSFQIRKPNINGTAYSLIHAVSWADNNNGNLIYFTGDATKRVYNMKNLVNNDPLQQSNWSNDSTLSGETPGIGNSPANIAWITGLNNNCQPFTGAALTITASSSGIDFCDGDTITLTSSLATGNSWSTGDTVNSIQVTASANITLNNAAACSSATRTLNFGSTTANFDTDTLQGFAPLKVKFTNASQANAINLSWNFGDSVVVTDSLNPSHIYNLPGVYTVVLTASTLAGCNDTALRTITVLALPVDATNVFEIPNVFTPNSDGSNDIFLIKNNNVQSFKGLIFDRWGNRVHEWSNLNEGWNGRTSAGKQVTEGVFFYQMNVTFADGTSITPAGTITLIK